MKEQALATSVDQGEGCERYRKQTRRDKFLARMEQIVPWQALCSVIEPHYPKAGRGRRPIGLERMLRMYFVQHWFNLADKACEDALLVHHGAAPLCGYRPEARTCARCNHAVEVS